MFFGIDESNHGRFPEIYVGLFSPYFVDGLKFPDSLGKKRNGSFFVPGHIFGSFLCFNETFARKFKSPKLRKSSLMIVSILEIIKFSKVSPSVIIVDGELLPKYLGLLEEKLKGILANDFKIIAEPKADIHYPIVNLADYLAHKIYKNRIKGDDLILPQVIPRVRDYGWLFH